MQGQATSARAVAVAVVVVIAVGTWLRLRGFASLELWADEAQWAERLLAGNPGWIRPIGYMWLTRGLMAVFGNTEPVLRSLSLVASVAQLPLMFLLLRRMFPAWLAVGGTWVLAVQPVAVAFAKEFKPYALEACLHTLLMYLALSYLAAPRTRLLVTTAVVSALTPLFAWSPVFLFPGLYLALLWRTHVDKNKRDLAIAAGGMVATLCVLGAIFWVRLRNADPHPEFWGDRYGVFYLASEGGTRLGWLWGKTLELFEMPGQLRYSVPVYRESIHVVVAALCWLGLFVSMLQRRWAWALLFSLSWLCFVAFNVLGQWPYGRFRTNVFALSYTIPLAVMSVDAIVRVVVDRLPRLLPALDARLGGRLGARTGIALAAVGSLSLLTALPIDEPRFDRKGGGTMTVNGAMLEAARMLRDTVGVPDAPILLAMDGQGCSVLRYYLERHAPARAELADWFAEHVELRCSVGRDAGYQRLLDELVAKEPRSFWIIVAKSSTAEDTIARLRDCDDSTRRRMRGATIAWCGRGGDKKPPLREGPPPDEDTAP